MGRKKTMAVARIVQSPNALFKKKAAAPAGKKAPKKRVAPVKKGKAPPKVEAPGLLEGAKDFFSQNSKTLEGNARSGSNAKGAQRYIGYRGTGQAGSAPLVDAQGNKAKFGGKVFRFGDKYGGGIDEYAPIFTPEDRSSTGDTYQGGLLGIAIWFVGFTSLLGVAGYAIYATSALA